MSFPGDGGQCDKCGYFKTWKHKILNPKSGKMMPSHIATQQPGVPAPVLGTGECALYQKGLQGVAQQPIQQLTQGTPWETPLHVPQQAAAPIQTRTSWTPQAPAPAPAPAQAWVPAPQPAAPAPAPAPAGNADLIEWLQDNLASPLSDVLGALVKEVRDIKAAIVALDTTMSHGVQGALANASLTTHDPTFGAED